MTLDLATIEQEARVTRNAETAAEARRIRLHQHIREAHAAGATLRQIAAAAGVSFQRIHQIVKEG